MATDTQEFHKAQISILRTLRHTPSARYTKLRRPTGLESDVFKFHLRKLQHQCYVHKLANGEYELTPSGKEFANNLSKVKRTVQKQPKLSVTIIASRGAGNTVEYLFQRRLRQPFYGFWSSLSGPVQWGESLEVAARREFEKQTGLIAAVYTVKGFYRQTDYTLETDGLLEDKLFAVIEVAKVRGNLGNDWQKGHNAWMTLEALKSQPKYFPSIVEFIEMMGSGEFYRTQAARYAPDEY
jgi:ADP-ribose pyrophosphatase YjhB (NUDIX family)/predicted transcriptional regulator